MWKTLDLSYFIKRVEADRAYRELRARGGVHPLLAFTRVLHPTSVWSPASFRYGSQFLIQQTQNSAQNYEQSRALYYINTNEYQALHSLLKYFSTVKERFRISTRPCNILYVWFQVNWWKRVEDDYLFPKSVKFELYFLNLGQDADFRPWRVGSDSFCIHGAVEAGFEQ